jgi:hypothetical protein
MHGKFPAIQQNQRNSILFHETIPLRLNFFSFLGLIFPLLDSYPDPGAHRRRIRIRNTGPTKLQTVRQKAYKIDAAPDLLFRMAKFVK